MKSLKVKIKLNYTQKIKLETISNEHRLLYNHLLEQARNGLSFKQLNEEYKNFRSSHKLTIQSKAAQNTSRLLINNIKSFYSLKKKDITVKFPYRSKGKDYFCTFNLDWNNGCGGFKIKDNILTITLFERKQKLEIQLPEVCKVVNEENIKTISFKREEDNYYIVFVYSEKPSNTKTLNENNFLSIDLGYSNIVTCFSNTIKNFSIRNLKQKKLQNRIEILQSKKDTKKKNSRRFKKLNFSFKRLKRKQSNKQKDFQHKLSKKIVDKLTLNDVGTLIIGDLKVKKVNNKINTKINGLSKSTSLSRFKTFLGYKAKNVGIKVYTPSEYNTSKTNSLTNKIIENLDLSIRKIELKEGLWVNRDLNAAINIAKKIKATWLSHFEDINYSLQEMFINNKSELLFVNESRCS